MSFLVWPGFFPTPISAKNEMHGMAPFVIASLKSLEDYFLCSNNFAQTMNNISKVFQLISIEKEAIREGDKRISKRWSI